MKSMEDGDEEETAILELKVILGEIQVDQAAVSDPESLLVALNNVEDCLSLCRKGFGISVLLELHQGFVEQLISWSCGPEAFIAHAAGRCVCTLVKLDPEKVLGLLLSKLQLPGPERQNQEAVAGTRPQQSCWRVLELLVKLLKSSRSASHPEREEPSGKAQNLPETDDFSYVEVLIQLYGQKVVRAVRSNLLAGPGPSQYWAITLCLSYTKSLLQYAHTREGTGMLHEFEHAETTCDNKELQPWARKKRQNELDISEQILFLIGATVEYSFSAGNFAAGPADLSVKTIQFYVHIMDRYASLQETKSDSFLTYMLSSACTIQERIFEAERKVNSRDSQTQNAQHNNSPSLDNYEQFYFLQCVTYHSERFQRLWLVFNSKIHLLLFRWLLKNRSQNINDKDQNNPKESNLTNSVDCVNHSTIKRQRFLTGKRNASRIGGKEEILSKTFDILSLNGRTTAIFSSLWMISLDSESQNLCSLMSHDESLITFLQIMLNIYFLEQKTENFQRSIISVDVKQMPTLLFFGLLPQVPNPTDLFFWMAEKIDFDASILLDWLITPETEFLCYFLEFVKYLVSIEFCSRPIKKIKSERIVNCLMDLANRISALVSKDLFPYDPSPLRVHLMRLGVWFDNLNSL